MAVQSVNGNQAVNAPQGARPPQPPAQEVQKPREEDQVNVSREARDKAKAEATRQEENARAEAARLRNAEQAKQEGTKQAAATQDKDRVDVTV